MRHMVQEDEEKAELGLSGDRPIEDPTDDRLGFAHFAEGLAKSLLGQTGTQGLVVGIHGPWGSGKTTLLNFVLHYLEELTRPSSAGRVDARAAENPNLLVVRFNPWWFTGREDLAVKLLDQFRASLVGEGERIRGISNRWATYPIPYLRLRSGFFRRLDSSGGRC
jgi:predicted KAP-like P-loop ATPase